MDNTAGGDDRRSSAKTDLSLLLECVKLQMACPDSQKQALITIHSICEKRGDNVDLLREMGGVMFLYNLSKSTNVHSEVKETALFTLATLAESNVDCKMSLCSEEAFLDLSAWLMKEDLPLRIKRVSVYLLSVLVADNKFGQTLAQTTGCLDNLLHLFRMNCPLSVEDADAEDSAHLNQLWVSLSSALCGCINNPQNRNGQQKCIVVFPFVKTWLEQISVARMDVFQPLCSFISTTVANNTHVQKTFSASGGLETLTLALVSLASGTEISLMWCQLSVIIAKTMTECITNNSFLASELAQYDVVPHLFSILGCPYLDCKDRVSILLTMAQCTEDCEEHQSQLVQCGGLPIIMSLMNEHESDAVRKTAAFIWQTCNQATTSLVDVPCETEEQEKTTPLKKMDAIRSSATEFLHRIEQLDKSHKVGPTFVGEEQNETSISASTHKTLHSPTTPDSHTSFEKIWKFDCKTAISATSVKKDEKTSATSDECFDSSSMVAPDRHSEGRLRLSCNATGMSVEGGRVAQRTARSCAAALTESVFFHSKKENNRFVLFFRRVFRSPPRRDLSKEFSRIYEQSENSIENISPQEKTLQSQIRCPGCVVAFENVKSHTFAHLLLTCPQICDMHVALHKATKKYRAQQCKLLGKNLGYNSEYLKTQHSGKASSASSEIRLTCNTVSERTTQNRHILNLRGISLTPWKKCTRSEASPSSTGSVPFKRPRLPPDPEHWVSYQEEGIEQKFCHGSKDFSPEEVHNLLCGVKEHGPSWSTILGSYSFKPGRTSEDLAKKYRRLKVL
ncbi:telomere repeats-binding bouquet formation protein 1 isoform X2 [Synchiropus splendidus]|uniref:telomere repeats-binding bouquet formation protein 1 isoform X2 n=1 Tax=Synchiropus splendidus TaxID=270530 RepID=UPI00237E080A|nr:telomere repeats-binding bouquet formation protein 1 isoform X2 [Synchiropus splendidus]